MSSENKLKLIDPENSSLTVEERKELDTKIQQLIEAHKGQRQEINRLTFESISAMATGDDYARELANKGWLRTLGGNITGSNKRLQDKINSSRAAAQYATQQTLQRLAEQNLLTVDLISEINKKLNISIVTVEGEVNEIYQTLIAIFKKSNVDVQELSGRIDEQQEKYQQLKQQMNSRCEACGAPLSEKQTVCFQCGAIDRILSLQTQKEHFHTEYSGRFQEGEFRKRIQFMYPGQLQQLRFRYTGSSVEAILDRLPTARIRETGPDGFLIEAEVYGKGILMWLLSQGSSVEVLSPQELRREIRQTLLDMLERYGAPD